jgi:hypothetical protein
MKTPKKSAVRSQLLLALLAVLGLWLDCPTRAQAQLCNSQSACPGDKAVMLSSGETNSHAFIDASALAGTDVCMQITAALTQLNTLNNILNPSGLYHAEGVIDARGITLTANNATCANNPWFQNGSPMPNPPFATILLPAGTIKISGANGTWLLPQNTRIIGQRAGQGTIGTTIQAASSFTGDLIDMGKEDKNYCQPNVVNNVTVYRCVGVAIEDLALDGASNSGVNGIFNQFSQELSYVNNVTMVNITGTGLSLGTFSGTGTSGAAVNSGPYSRLNISVSSTGKCVQILGTNSTRGIHGLSCSIAGTSGAAVYLDAPNNSIEDANINSSGSGQDGVLVGSQAPAQNNLLTNINGSGLLNVIHISATTNSSSNCPANTDVCDLAIFGATRSAGTNTIKDELTGSTVTSSTVGMYTLGEQIFGGSSPGYSRLTTSPGITTFLVGAIAPAGSCATGTIYSCTGGSTACTASSITATIWGCAGGAWSKIK